MKFNILSVIIILLMYTVYHCKSLYNTADFSFSEQNLTFSTGDTAGEQRCGFANITDDNTVENNESFLVSFTTSDHVVEFASDQSTQTEVTIIDNDGTKHLMATFVLVLSHIPSMLQL